MRAEIEFGVRIYQMPIHGVAARARTQNSLPILVAVVEMSTFLPERPSSCLFGRQVSSFDVVFPSRAESDRALATVANVLSTTADPRRDRSVRFGGPSLFASRSFFEPTQLRREFESGARVNSSLALRTPTCLGRFNARVAAASWGDLT